MSTDFIYKSPTTLDDYGSPHVMILQATRATDGTHYSSWGFAVECDACGKRVECPNASSVTAEDYPRQFASEHRNCLPGYARNALERDHIARELSRIAKIMLKGGITNFYAEQIQKLGARLSTLYPR